MAFPADLEEEDTDAPLAEPLAAPAPSYGGELDEDFRDAAIEAFPELDGDDGRIAALKSMIEICLDSRGDVGDEKGGPMPKSGGGAGADLALVFGKGGK